MSRRYVHSKSHLSEYADKSVTMANPLIEAGHNLSVSEKKVICLAISKINSLVGAESENEVCVSIEDALPYCGNDRDAANLLLRHGTSKLYERSIKYKEIDLNDGLEMDVVQRWIYKKASKRNGQVILSFSPDVFNLLTNLSRDFTSYKLESLMKLSLKSSIRLFELLVQRQDTTSFKDNRAHRIISIDDLNLALDLSPSAIINNHLSKRHIFPAIEEINKKLKFDIECVKNKKSWHFSYLTGAQIDLGLRKRSAKKKAYEVPEYIRLQKYVKESKRLAGKGYDVIGIAEIARNTTETQVKFKVKKGVPPPSPTN